MLSRHLRWLAIVCASALAHATSAVEPESAHLRVLLVVDTDDAGGITWGRDGANMKALLEADFEKQKLQGRFTIDLLAGPNVTPEKILGYYKTLKIEATDSLLFYYSGHGGTHLNKGHFLALTHGKLYRKELLGAMEALKPRLCVMLTDCCSNYAGGAWSGEPKQAAIAPIQREDAGSTPAARREEPPAARVVTRPANPQRVFRPARPPQVPTFTFPKAKPQEPTGYVFPVRNPMPRNFAIAPREEPTPAVGDAAKLPRNANLPTLTTHQGKVFMGAILDASDGEVLRHLLFRHQGLVDINGCAKGESSFGTIEWGGSLFTNSLIALQKAKVADFDKNGNRVVEWSEFFPEWQRSTKDAGARLPRGRVSQVPEATKLGEPIRP